MTQWRRAYAIAAASCNRTQGDVFRIAKRYTEKCTRSTWALQVRELGTESGYELYKPRMFVFIVLSFYCFFLIESQHLKSHVFRHFWFMPLLLFSNLVFFCEFLNSFFIVLFKTLVFMSFSFPRVTTSTGSVAHNPNQPMRARTWKVLRRM